MKYVFLCFSLILFFPICPVYSETVEVKDLVVETYRLPVESSYSTQNVSIISNSDIKDIQPVTLDEMLRYEGGIDIQTRGPMGIQSDVNMRGGSFEQMLVVLDGVPLRDPQTGHFLMDVPLVPQNIEKIEILKGGGASLYGANAMTGVIHIVTKKPEKMRVFTQLQGGDFGFWEGTAVIDGAKDAWSWSVTLDHKESDGYMEDTDFTVRTANARLRYEKDRNMADFFIGLLDKDFGAANFYSNLYPHEEEHTENLLGYLSGRYFLNEDHFLTARLYQRKQKDHFILNRRNPDLFQSSHTNIFRGFEAFLKKEGEVSWAVGGVAGEDDIESTSLGDRKRDHLAGVGEMSWMADEKTFFQAMARLDDFEDFETDCSASAGISRFITERWKIRFSAERAFRVPSFTELYYQSPANRGNPDLEKEESVSIEGGVEYIRELSMVSFSLFQRAGENIIDWVRVVDTDVWQAENIREIDFTGFEIEGKQFFEKKEIPVQLEKAVLFYSYTQASEDETDIFSKYTFQYPRHLFQGRISILFPWDIRQSLFTVYKERKSSSGNWIFGTVISKEITHKDWSTKGFISIENLFDEDYDEIGCVKMPGRWVRAGMSFSF